MDKGTALGTLALVIAAAVGLQALLREDGAAAGANEPGSRVIERLERLERRLSALEASDPVAAVGSAVASPRAVQGSVAERLEAVEDHLLVLQAKASLDSPPAAGGTPSAMASGPTPPDSTLSAKIDQAVSVRVAELEAERKRKANKEPTFAVFAEALKLDVRQQQTVEHEIREGQKTMRALLATPVADGPTVLDELVEVMAYGQAQHPDAGKRWMSWYTRVTTETVPGTEETYAARAEAIKVDVHAALERELSPEQYAEVKDWDLDPTEIKEIEDTPWGDLEARVNERAEVLRQTR